MVPYFTLLGLWNAQNCISFRRQNENMISRLPSIYVKNNNLFYLDRNEQFPSTKLISKVGRKNFDYLIKQECKLLLLNHLHSFCQPSERFISTTASLHDSTLVNTLRPTQHRRHFTDIFKCIFVNQNIWTSISLKFVLKDRINNIPALVQIMA